MLQIVAYKPLFYNFRILSGIGYSIWKQYFFFNIIFFVYYFLMGT